MQIGDYYRQYRQCVDMGLVHRIPREDHYTCGKFGGYCSMSKCVKCHNNGTKVLQPAEE